MPMKHNLLSVFFLILLLGLSAAGNSRADMAPFPLGFTGAPVLDLIIAVLLIAAAVHLYRKLKKKNREKK